jgi:hypothetical protein
LPCGVVVFHIGSPRDRKPAPTLSIRQREKFRGATAEPVQLGHHDNVVSSERIYELGELGAIGTGNANLLTEHFFGAGGLQSLDLLS